MEDNKIRVGITQGDINGVGYEVILNICRPGDAGIVHADYLRFA
jgi:4-hydroxy-L-threonine phosphate dehydrogenase PdxA